MHSTVTIPLSEYKLMEKRIKRKKDEIIPFYYSEYYGSIKQKELLLKSDNARKEAQQELQKIKEQFETIKWEIIINEPSEVISNYKKAIRNLYIALWISLITIVILTIW